MQAIPSLGFWGVPRVPRRGQRAGWNLAKHELKVAARSDSRCDFARKRASEGESLACVRDRLMVCLQSLEHDR